MSRLTAMQRFEEQQRLKLMSRKIASAKSILKKENIIGNAGRGPYRANAALGACPDSGIPTPMQSDDSGMVVMRKVKQPSARKRPEWQDINRQDYASGGRPAPRVQYAERRKPHRVLPQASRDALARGLLERAEAISHKMKVSPKHEMREAAEAAEAAYARIRHSLGSAKKDQEGARAKSSGDTQAEADDLAESIDALSSVLDSKLALIAEASQEHLAGTASSFVHTGHPGGVVQDEPGGKGLQDAACDILAGTVSSFVNSATRDAGTLQGREETARTNVLFSNAPATASSEDDPVVRTSVTALDESGADVCLHSDSMDDDTEAAKPGDEAEEDQGEYDDDFENSLEAAGSTPGQKYVCEKVVEKLEETEAKLDALECALSCENEPTLANTTHDTRPGVTAAYTTAVEEQVVTGQANLCQAAPPKPARASKPFSFKSKGAGAGAGVGVASVGSGAGKNQGTVMALFASGPTILNANHHKAGALLPAPDAHQDKPEEANHCQHHSPLPPHELLTADAPRAGQAAAPATTAAVGASGVDIASLSRVERIKLMRLQNQQAAAAGGSAELRPDAAGSVSKVPEIDESGFRVAAGASTDAQGAVSPLRMSPTVPSTAAMGGVEVATGAACGAQAPARAASAGPWGGRGGRAGRGLLNLDHGQDQDGVAADSEAPNTRGRAGRGLLGLRMGGSSDVSDAGGPDVGGGEARGATSRAATASPAVHVASRVDERQEWEGGGGAASRGVSAKKKISKEEIRKAMQAARADVGAVDSTVRPETAASETMMPPPTCGAPAGRRRPAAHAPQEEEKVSAVAGEKEGGRVEADGGACTAVTEAAGAGGDEWGLLMGSAQDRHPAPPPSAGFRRGGPVRATGPPRFASGIGADAKAEAAESRSRSPEVDVSPLNAGGRDGVGVARGMDSSLDRLDRSLECEML